MGMRENLIEDERARSCRAMAELLPLLAGLAGTFDLDAAAIGADHLAEERLGDCEESVRAAVAALAGIRSALFRAGAWGPGERLGLDETVAKDHLLGRDHTLDTIANLLDRVGTYPTMVGFIRWTAAVLSGRRPSPRGESDR